MGIEVESSVSWLHDTLRIRLTERAEGLMYKISKGVPQDEYRQMVGRFRENERQQSELAELFEEFYTSEDDTGEELGDLTDDDD